MAYVGCRVAPLRLTAEKVLTQCWLAEGAQCQTQPSLAQVRGSHTFSVKDQILNICRFVGHVAFAATVTTLPLCHWRAKAATGNLQTSGYDCVPIKLLFFNLTFYFEILIDSQVKKIYILKYILKCYIYADICNV